MLKLLIFLSIIVVIHGAEPQDSKVFFLEAGDVVKFNPESRRRGFFETDMRIYCYEGSNKTLSRLFQSVQLRLFIENDDFTQYEGTTPDMVQIRYEEQRSMFSLNSIFSSKKTVQKLNPFNQTCIGIDTIQPYQIQLHLIRVDFWRVIVLFLGLFIFLSAADLSQNTVFYYMTGILIGIFASFLVLMYLLGKILPKRKMMYGALIGGYAVGIYMIQFLWENIQLIMVTYQTYVFWYICITGFISFVVCYRLGPPKNERSKNLIKWGLQLTALVMVFFSSYFEEATTAIIVLTVVFYYFPQKLLLKSKAWYSRKFPPKPRLLTSDEYFEQGVKETAVALEQLREYCSSPDCKQWKIVTKLKDPIKFASFIEGDSHLTDSEILNYEVDRQDLSEDEDDEEDQIDDSEISDDQEELMSEDDNNSYAFKRNGYTVSHNHSSHSTQNSIKRRFL